MILNESTISVAKLKSGDYFIDDNEIYKVNSIDHERNCIMVDADNIIENRDIELRFDFNEKVNSAIKKDIIDFRVKHFEKVTGFVLHKDYDKGNYIVVNGSQKKISKAVKDYNRKYNTDIYYLGIDNNDGSIRLAVSNK